MTDDQCELPDFWAVVPAGGSGTRLWPISRSKRPKFLLDITGNGRTLLQTAWDRLTPLCGSRFLLVTGTAHELEARRQLPGLSERSMLIEPAPRDSMAAIGLAAATLEARDPELILGSFPADHVIPNANGLHDCIRQGYAAAKTGLLALIGLEPTRPTSALGYIRMGPAIGIDAAPGARRIESFIEKPSEDRAIRFIHAGGYVWNAGMWIAKAGVLMGLLESANPQLAGDLRAAVKYPDRLIDIWENIERTTIDKTIAEPLAGTPKVCIIPGDFEWEDIGDFGALLAYLNRHEPSVDLHAIPNADEIFCLDATGVVVGNSHRPIAVMGLDNVVIVDTQDALLVMSEEYSQRLKDLYADVTLARPEVG